MAEEGCKVQNRLCQDVLYFTISSSGLLSERSHPAVATEPGCTHPHDGG